MMAERAQVSTRPVMHGVRGSGEKDADYHLTCVRPTGVIGCWCGGGGWGWGACVVEGRSRTLTQVACYEAGGGGPPPPPPPPPPGAAGAGGGGGGGRGGGGGAAPPTRPTHAHVLQRQHLVRA